MKSILYILFMLSIISCDTNHGKNSIMSKPSDSIMNKPAHTVNIIDGNDIISLYKVIQNKSIQLVGNQNLELPEMKESNGRFNVYDPAFDEPISEVALSPSKTQLRYSYGDYNVIIVKLPCATNHVGIVVSNLMGNFTNYSLKVCKLSNKDMVDVTEKVVDFTKVISVYENTQDTVEINQSDLQYDIKENGDVAIRLNESKLNLKYKENNSDASTINNYEDQKSSFVNLKWLNTDCKFKVI